MKFRFILFITIFFLSTKAYSEIAVNYDYAVFYGSEGAYIELYYSYPDVSYTLHYDTLLETYFGGLDFALRIDSGGTQVSVANWEARFQHKRDTNAYTPQDFYGIERIPILVGNYKAEIVVTDMYVRDRHSVNTFDIVVLERPSGLGLSSIEVANNIIYKKADDRNNYPEVFYKNQYYVYPNPLREISSDTPTLYLYSEIYNAQSSSPEGVDISYKISDAKNVPVVEYSKHKQALGDAIVETVSFPLDAVQSGVYTVEMICYNKTDTVRSECKFYLINNNIDEQERVYYTEDEAFALSEFAVFSSERVDLEFEQFKVLASKEEVSSWEKLSDTKAKQRFLYRFWLERNPDPSNPYNKALADYRDRVKYAITYFSYSGGDNGWKSDRGKVYIKHGDPSHKEQSPSDPRTRAYEIWSYNTEGGATFCFIDVSGMNNYRLVHSNLPGYVQNYNWRNMLTSTANSQE